ncbi:MAG: UPF0280 family protein [Rhizobiaceae bacterium]|nr:UPF0280 family protein [Rhizobiaceae bacterium]MCV0405098.1 UPF0280 family protein [Rhizobiaceae bacterium]
MNGPQTVWLPDGRLHLNHGPIDLIVEAFGEAEEVAAAFRQAIARFETVLDELVAELPALRRPSSATPRRFDGRMAASMEAAACRLAAQDAFVTPMAAVAGAVADEVLAALVVRRRLDRAYVNDGGDTAFFLAPGRSITAAIAGTTNGIPDRVTIRHGDPVRGLATSGWRGRSHSLGIADAVTVLARNAAEADAAATLIANAVDLPGSPKIERRPARELAPDSDLGERLVTVGVAALSRSEVDDALRRGFALAERYRRQGLIEAAALFLAGQAMASGTMPSALEDGGLAA